ncbi:11270_t:CDS:2 [Funneliformis geosporum]|uniref:11270_t:CDS:1 n=1 Tax=Funneliformis geosporum TaxID=1117311 RepID=A0A9W4T1Q3_9GLOM|nr:11270_t:CDS:2 [Funneliformis geosporum]
MRIEQREYHNIAEFFNQLEEAKKKFEETYKAKLIPFEKYLERELNNPGKKHLIELFKQLEIDLRTHQEVFWEQVAGKLTTFPSPVVSELVQEKLDQVKEFIDRSFAGKKEFCVDWQAFKAHEEAIVKDLEIRLTEGSYKYLHNPQLFLSTVNTQTTNYNNTVGNSNTVSGNIKEIAENLGIFGAQRAHLTKNQETKKIEEGIKLNEIDHFDENSNDETQTSDNSQTNNGNNTHFTSQESFNVALLQ